jgi:hypothetical protein
LKGHGQTIERPRQVKCDLSFQTAACGFAPFHPIDGAKPQAAISVCSPVSAILNRFIRDFDSPAPASYTFPFSLYGAVETDDGRGDLQGFSAG